jgi:hypothetical protein
LVEAKQRDGYHTRLPAAASLTAGFHIRIENDPWMTLVIKDTQERGPSGLPAISVAHYGKQNGDLMRDREMMFEAEESGEQNEAGALLLAK